MKQIETEYQKERRRIRAFIRRAEKRGFSFPANVIPPKPKRVTKSSVSRLRKITPDVLYEKSIYGGEATYGEIVSGKQGLKAEKAYKRAKRRALKKYNLPKAKTKSTAKAKTKSTAKAKTKSAVKTKSKSTTKTEIKRLTQQKRVLPKINIANVVVNNIRAQISHMPKEINEKLNSLIDSLIFEQGIEAVAYALSNMPMTFYEYLSRSGYDSNASIEEFATDLINYLPDVSEQYKKDIMDAYEMNELGYYIED